MNQRYSMKQFVPSMPCLVLKVQAMGGFISDLAFCPCSFCEFCRIVRRSANEAFFNIFACCLAERSTLKYVITKLFELLPVRVLQSIIVAEFF